MGPWGNGIGPPLYAKCGAGKKAAGVPLLAGAAVAVVDVVVGGSPVAVALGDSVAMLCVAGHNY